ncbi:hypothetical protein [Sphingopyxis terrae]|uniref:hypothetical protein n=1 Tax=Sphingopyxis terrae TaxID=33052 RepID=UPI003F81BD9A
MVNLGAQKLAKYRGDASMEAVGAEIDVGRMTWHGWEHGNRIPSKAMMVKLVALVPGLDAGDFYREAVGAENDIAQSEAA